MKTSKVRHLLVSYFTYTRKERNAALVLTGLILGIQLITWFRMHISEPATAVISMEEETAFTSMKKSKYRKSTGVKEFDARVRMKPEIVEFDPNTTDSSGFVALGLSPRQAGTVIRYRNKIGGFKTREALKNVRVISPYLYLKWEPHIVIRKDKIDPKHSRLVENTGYRKSFPAKKQERPVLDVNRADTNALMDLPLIGSGRARAIVMYRERLGGFINVEQLREVKAIPDSVYEVIVPYLRVVSGPFRKLDINHLPADSMRHPYLSWQLARLIVSYRAQHGFFKTYEDLTKLPLVNAEILSKLAPYLLINP